MNYNPETLGMLVQKELEKLQTRAELAEKFALKKREEFNELVDKRVEEYKNEYLNQAKLSYGRFNFKEEASNWRTFLDNHLKTCYTPLRKGRANLPYIIPYTKNYLNGYVACCPECGAEQDITYKAGYEDD